MTSAAVALFERRAAGRGKRDLIFTRADGAAWDKDNIQKPMRAAVGRANLEGTFYALRHSHCSFALKHAGPVKDLADNTGTSLRMIERHYAHVLRKDRLAAFAAAGFGGAIETTVVNLDRAAR